MRSIYVVRNLSLAHFLLKMRLAWRIVAKAPDISPAPRLAGWAGDLEGRGPDKPVEPCLGVIPIAMTSPCCKRRPFPYSLRTIRYHIKTMRD